MERTRLELQGSSMTHTPLAAGPTCSSGMFPMGSRTSQGGGLDKVQC